MSAISVDEVMVLDYLGVIAEKKQLLYGAYNDLKQNLEKISTNWESNGMDKQSYVIGLEKEVSKMNDLVEQLSLLESKVKQYIEDLKVTSNNTI